MLLSLKCLPPPFVLFAKHAILNFFVRLYVSLPPSTTGAHAKKQGEDLSENDGDEDEGIFHGEQKTVHDFLLKRTVTVS